jgi:hypothetical protein
VQEGPRSKRCCNLSISFVFEVTLGACHTNHKCEVCKACCKQVYNNTGCLKNSVTMVFQKLLCDECYENFYILRRINYISFKVFNDG